GISACSSLLQNEQRSYILPDLLFVLKPLQRQFTQPMNSVENPPPFTTRGNTSVEPVAGDASLATGKLVLIVSPRSFFRIRRSLTPMGCVDTIRRIPRNPSDIAGNKSSANAAMYPPAGTRSEVTIVSDERTSGATSSIIDAGKADGFASAKPECRAADFSTY